MADTIVNWKKFVNWVLFNALFALFPLLSVWFFRALLRKSAVETVSDFPEILFFSLMVCATTVSDLRGLEKPSRWALIFFTLEAILLFGATGSAILYGGVRVAGIINPDMTFQSQLLTYSIVVSVLLFILSVTSEILVAIVDRQR